MNSKKIAIVSPSLKMGGIERALTVLADFFIEKGHQVYFISAQGGEHFYQLNEKVTVFEPEVKRQSGILGKIMYYYNLVTFLKSTINTIKPDAVLSFGDAFNPLVLLALKGTKIPVFISDRTSPDFKFNAIISYGKKYLYPKASGFIAQTQRAADYKIKQFGSDFKIKIIPNAVKEVKIYDVLKKKQIVSVGRLSYEKGQDRLIKAFALMQNSSDWELVLAGSGPMSESLKTLANELGIIDRIQFLGNVDNVDLLLSESSIFVLPSRLEGFPNALCEAMIAGLACVCFDSIPHEVLIENNSNGIVIKENDIAELATKLDELVGNPDLRLKIGTKAKELKSELSPEANGNQILDFMFSNL